MLSLEWDNSEDSKFGGSLCARGNAVVEFVTHPKRLNYPYILNERSTFDAAVKETARNLSAIREEFGSESIGVLVGDNLTNEEADLTLRFARDVLGTENVALFAPDDIPVFRAYLSCDLSGLKPSEGKPAGDAEISLIVGDAFSDHPCIAKHVLPGKYVARGSEVIAISPETNHTAWFANRHLRCRPGGEAAVAAGLLMAAAEKSKSPLIPWLAGVLSGMQWNEIERLGGVSRDDIEEAALSLLGALKVRAYISNIFGRIGAPDLTSLFIEALTRICPGESEYNPQFVQQNTWGLYSVLRGAGNGRILERIGGAELKALVILGLDLFSVYPAAPVEKALREKRFTVTTQLFRSQTASRANVVIPAAALIEKKGTVSPAFDEDLVRDEALPPPGGTFTEAELLHALAREMGTELSAGGSVERRKSRGGVWEGLGEDWLNYKNLMGELDAAETVLIPLSEPAHVADGSISRNFHWSEITCPKPRLMMSNKLADDMKLKNGEIVTVSSDGGEAALPVERTGRLEGNTVGATIHFPSVRRLFPWKLDERHGEIVLAPVPVSLSAQGEKS